MAALYPVHVYPPCRTRAAVLSEHALPLLPVLLFLSWALVCLQAYLEYPGLSSPASTFPGAEVSLHMTFAHT